MTQSEFRSVLYFAMALMMLIATVVYGLALSEYPATALPSSLLRNGLHPLAVRGEALLAGAAAFIFFMIGLPLLDNRLYPVRLSSIILFSVTGLAPVQLWFLFDDAGKFGAVDWNSTLQELVLQYLGLLSIWLLWVAARRRPTFAKTVAFYWVLVFVVLNISCGVRIWGYGI